MIRIAFLHGGWTAATAAAAIPSLRAELRTAQMAGHTAREAHVASRLQTAVASQYRAAAGLGRAPVAPGPVGAGRGARRGPRA